ncbi:protein kinase [Tolypothrix sp. PCC 7910]|uniref:protein kinase domain-containing protein n=1 Tax=Tolypothrix sp. PCC 7910 TaxID=2099387 RepID=UPI00142770C4|nr:protein kinase [Tolypothrix sp. PCC 7910]QIR37637.1 protein kinase [Tolypothrix sp. PCC 7910]
MVWNPGQELFGSRYIIERKLGEGGIGITYLARNQQGEFRVIKTIREQILNHPDWIPHQNLLRQNFRDEALVLSLCRHRHIVQIENAFFEENFPCMAMEYIEGEDLGRRISQKGALPEAEALIYIRQISDALTLIHQRGLLHRDLKPSNIMMRAGKPEAVLIDFGLAQGFIPDVTHTLPGGLTHGFAPPEQYLPKARWGEYTDVYALAATLYSLLTGQLPAPVPARLQNTNLIPPKDLNSRISDKVNEAIIQGMELKYELRPRSVQEWLDLLGMNTGVTSGTDNVTQKTSTPQPSIQNLKSPNSSVVISQNWNRLNTIPGIGKKFTLDFDGRILALATENIGNENSINLLELSDVEFGICRHMHTLTGHSTEIGSLAFGYSGGITTLLASGGADGTIKVWDIATGKEVYTLHHSEWAVWSLAFSPDMKTLASGHGREGTVQLWDVATGRKIHTFPDSGGFHVHSIAFSPTYYEYSNKKVVEMLAIGNLYYLAISLIAHGQEVYFNPKNVQMLPSSNTYWKPQEEAHSQAIFIPCGRVNSVAFSQDGQLLATAGEGVIRLWRITGSLTYKIFFRQSIFQRIQNFIGMFFTRHKSLRSFFRGVIRVEEIHQLTGHYGNIWSAAFSQDGKILASGGEDKTVKLWDVVTGQEIRTFTDDPDRVDRINSVSFGSFGKDKLASSYTNTIKLRQVETGREIITFAGNMSWYIGDSKNIDPIALSPDGQILASVSFRWIQLWEVGTGRAIKILRDHEYPIRSIAFSPDGLLLASGGQDNIIKLWHMGTLKEIRILSGHSHTVNSLSFSPDGKLLVSMSYEGTIRLWEVATGREISTFNCPADWVNSVNFSFDRQLLAIGSKGTTIKVCQVETGAEIDTFNAPSQFNSFAFSSDRQLLAIASEDKTVKLLHVATRTEICKFTASLQVHSISFSANGQLLAIGEYGGNIQIWERS